MKNPTAKFQIGKQGLTQGVIEALNLAMKTHHQLRISVLKSAERDREKIKILAEQIQSKIKQKTTIKIIGFTLILNKAK